MNSTNKIYNRNSWSWQSMNPWLKFYFFVMLVSSLPGLPIHLTCLCKCWGLLEILEKTLQRFLSPRSVSVDFWNNIAVKKLKLKIFIIWIATASFFAGFFLQKQSTDIKRMNFGVRAGKQSCLVRWRTCKKLYIRWFKRERHFF